MRAVPQTKDSRDARLMTVLRITRRMVAAGDAPPLLMLPQTGTCPVTRGGGGDVAGRSVAHFPP